MVEKHLVTTALEETWPDPDSKIIFVGEWCKLYSKKKSWENLSYEVVDYHWDNRKKFEKDYYYLTDFYEKTLEKLSIQMNSIHQVNHSLKYWRILLGPWLSLFIQSVFDRWEMIRLVTSSNDKLKSNIIIDSEFQWTPYDYNNFKKLVMESDEWNNFIYTKIIELYPDKITVNNLNENSRSNKTTIKKNNFKIFLLNIYQPIANFINSNKSSLIFSSYLSKIDETLLSLRLLQLPLFINLHEIKNHTPDRNQRNWKVNIDTSSNFEKFALGIIPNQLPSVYMEGYKSINKKLKKLNWPKSPRSIFTSNSIHVDEIFKHYAGINEKSSLIIGQHGGSYGISKLNFSEYHELSIADRYISWGWTNKSSNSKIHPLGQLNSKSIKKSNSNKTKLLMVTCVLPRYSYVLQSMTISSQWLSYFKNQIEFVKNLDESISSETTVRLYRHDYKWNQIERWKDIFPNLNYDKGFSNLETLYNETKLYVATYNATTYLETFRLNIPTVIFWDPNYWENTDSVKTLFNELKRVKVFHDSPESAAKHINEIWDNVEGWWESSEVTEVINKFNKSVNRYNKNLVSDLIKILK
jgi:putative transferase (TIGR04331 family)